MATTRKTTAKKPAAPKAAKPAATKAAAPEAAEKLATKPAAPKAAAKPKTARKPAAKAAPKASAKPAAVRAKPATTAGKGAAPKAPAKSSVPSRALGAFSIGAAVVAVGAAIVEGVRRFRGPGNAEHQAPDLALDQPLPGSEGRAAVDFRPDPTAPVPASEREGLRPATLAPNRELDRVH